MQGNSLMSQVDQSAVMKAGLIGGVASFVLGLVGLTPLVCCIWFVPLLVGLGTGALYDRFAEQNGRQVTVQSGAVGGAMAGVGVAVGGVIVSILVALIGMALGTAAAGTVEDAAVNLGGGLVSIVGNICFSAAFGIGLGAVGGALYAAIQSNRSGGMSTPPPAV